MKFFEKKHTAHALKMFIIISFFSFILFPIQVLAQTVDLQIPIGETTSIPVCSEGVCHGITLYIVEVAKWIVGALSMLAVLFIMIGGLIWLTSRADQKQVALAKKLIFDSLGGLGLVLGSYLLLSVISPDLVNLKDLSILQIGKIDQQFQEALDQLSGGSGQSIQRNTQNTKGGQANSAGINAKGLKPCPQKRTQNEPPCASADDINRLKAGGKIVFRGVAGGCSEKAMKNGEWDAGIRGETTHNGERIDPVDRRTLASIVLIAQTCGTTYINALNERCGHDGHGHGKYSVDIGDPWCGAPTSACNQIQERIIAKLKSIGYDIGMPGGSCGASFKDSSGHIHIQTSRRYR